MLLLGIEIDDFWNVEESNGLNGPHAFFFFLAECKWSGVMTDTTSNALCMLLWVKNDTRLIAQRPESVPTPRFHKREIKEN